MTTAQVEVPPKLIPVFVDKPGEVVRFRGAYGGRGSAKSRTFALMTAIRGFQMGRAGREGLILCTREYMNSLDDSSMEEIKAAIASHDWLAAYYEVGEKFVRSRDGRVRYAFAGLRQNVNSLKSKARILLNWTDEAENVRETSWQKLVPTVREDDSEIWVTWNPESKKSATHLRFREDPPADAKIVEINWRDNPWFPAVLERDRREDLEKRPHIYEHVWEGKFATHMEGAYFAEGLAKAREERRIGRVAADPLLSVRAYWDIGGTGARADQTAIWIVQFVGREVRVLDYYEAQGQPLATHVAWLRERGYDKATCVLPHDGETHDRVHKVSYESALKDAGFPVVVIPNQGKGAAAARIEAVRRLLPSCWFHEETTAPGLEALGWYHERRDDERGIGLGPEHDWASHGADAFGLMAVAYEAHANSRTADVSKLFAGAGRSAGWMGR